MKPAPNLLLILSDQHSRAVTGCYGDRHVSTPNIDALAAGGTLFRSAYCNAPICVPSRASLATGRYPHAIGTWDNAHPYTGRPMSWMHRVRDAGVETLSIGKLHYRGGDDDYGFSDTQLPMHVAGGKGLLLSLIRDEPLPQAHQFRKMIDEAGPGSSSYLDYDQSICERAERWLREAAPQKTRPFALQVSFVCPHPPFIAPPEFYERYAADALPLPRAYGLEERPDHPTFADLRRFFCIEDELEESALRRVITAYYGMVSFLDHSIGRLLRALRDAGLVENTLVIYASDHGESLGQKGLFSKCNMLEESAGVPLIMSGPSVGRGREVHAPVSLVDIYPTILDSFAIAPTAEEADLPGTSLLSEQEYRERTIFAEQHSAGVKSAMYMVRRGRFKYIREIGYRPQLYDLQSDPAELNDLADDPKVGRILGEYERHLRAVLDPEEADAAAQAAQALRIRDFGGRDAVIRHGSPGFTPAPSAH